MNKKSFFLGFAAGAVVAIAVLFVIGLIYHNDNSVETNGKVANKGSVEKNEKPASNSPVDFLEMPVSYENKKEASFEVFQVLAEDAALANEMETIYGELHPMGKTVLILGKDFYSQQVITIKNPMRVGTYSYTSRSDMPITVPVIDSTKQ